MKNSLFKIGYTLPITPLRSPNSGNNNNFCNVNSSGNYSNNNANNNNGVSP